MGRISPKFGIKILAILGFTLVLGFFISSNSAKAQVCSDVGYACSQSGNGLECINARCVKPLHSYCSSRDDCFTPRYGDTYLMSCKNNECCGRYFYPCSGNEAGTPTRSSECCNDPGNDGAFYCATGPGYCVLNCFEEPYGHCTAWVNRGCAQGGCAANQMWQSRTCLDDCDLTQCVTDCTCNLQASSICYNNDRYWIDACGSRTNNIREECGDSSCGTWYECGCQDSRYKKNCQDCTAKGCINDACTSTPTTNFQQGIDCGINYCEAWTNAGCNGNLIRETRTCHNRGCASGACFDTPYTEERTTTNCGTNSCDNWTACGCDGDFIKECRTCHTRGCNSGSCFDNPYTEERRTTDCNTSDGCSGSTYRDFYCSSGTCAHNDVNCDSRCDNPPNVPTLIAPNNNSWINYDPTFQATSINPEGGNIRVHFNLMNNPDGVGNWVASGNSSQWGPVNLGGTCIDEWWQTQAEDTCNLFSNWSGWWRVRVDEDLPTCSISYPTGTVNYTNFNVNLSAADICSEINEGNVDVSLDHGATWTDQGLANNGRTTSNFPYIGSPGQCYRFRYTAKDSADNWSNFAEGGELCIDISIPTASISYPDEWINYNPFNVVLTEEDPGGTISQGNVEIQSKSKNTTTWPIWSSHANTINDFSFTGQNCYFYKFRYRVQDNASNWSVWSDPGYITKIDVVKPSASINYATGTVNSTTFTVNLSDSDDCSGVTERSLQVSIDDAAWQNYPASVVGFTYTGSYGHRYKLRYRVKDDANNWSDWVEGGTIELKALPIASPSDVVWTFCPDINLTLKWSYSDVSNLPQTSFHIQIDDNADFSSPVLDTNEIINPSQQYIFSSDALSNLMKRTKYFWQIRVKNSAGDWSPWKSNQNFNFYFEQLDSHSTI